MKKSLIALFLLCQVYQSAVQAVSSWLPAAQQIPITGSGDTGVGSDIIMAYYPKNNTVIATWGDVGYVTEQHPYFSVYNGSTWTTAAAIPLTGSTSTGVFDAITVAYYPKNQTMIAAWNDANFPYLAYYAVYDGDAWSTPAQIDPAQSLRTLDNIYMIYNPQDNTMLAAYGLGIYGTTPYVPYYTIYDGTSWTTPAVIPVPSGGTILDDVRMTFDSANHKIIAAWADFNTHLPYYSVFKNGTWTTALLTPLGASSGVHFDVNVVYDPVHNRTIAAWGDSVSPFLPYYSVYHGGAWSIPAVIPYGTSVGVAYDVNLAFDPDTQTVLLAWSDANPALYASGNPYFSVLKGSTWTAGTVIPLGTSYAAFFNVNLTYDPCSHQMIGAWGNYPGASVDPAYPYYSVYAATTTPSTHVKGKWKAKLRTTAK